MESVRTEYREADTTGLFNRIAKLFESRKEKEVKIDSVVERSKETVVLNEKGDTTKHFQYLYIHLSTKERQKLEDMIAERDSTIKDLRAKKSEIKHDSIPVPYPVEKELSRWQQAKMDAGGIAMGAAGVLFIALCIAVWWIKKKRK